jgi:hypothetical protein
MDHTQSSQAKRDRRARGQTLFEFAFTLPLLLILIFGVIEFGRLFQSWVTIQNAAREATRYATTGQYDKDRYPDAVFDENGDLIQEGAIDALLPCDPQGVREDLRGNRYIVRPVEDDASYEVEIFAASAGDGHDPRTYPLGEESLFATWYDGVNCERSEDHLEMRRDILRVASITNVARIGAAGLFLEPNPLDGSRESLANLLYDQWDIPMPRSDQIGYLGVSICSSRAMADSLSQPASILSPSRFLTVREDITVPPAYSYDYTRPYCMLNEVRPGVIEGGEPALANHGLRWIDPGGGGDRVEVFITYNHPLITPLGLAEYVTMRARRSGVNEAFRASRALSAVLGSPLGVGQPTFTPLPPTDTPLPTDEPPPGDQPTATDPPPPTATQGPFTCDNLTVSNPFFQGQTISFTVTNDNYEDTWLERTRLLWQRPASYPAMYLSSLWLNGQRHWRGEQSQPPLDTADLSAEDQQYFLSSNRDVAALDVSLYQASFAAGPPNLGSVMSLSDFGGTELYFYNPLNPGQPCAIALQVVPPGDDDDSDSQNPTATYTPDCASDGMSVDFERFDTFGVVVMHVTNNYNTVGPLWDFNIVWPHPQTLDPPLSLGILRLDKISVGGVDADDPNGTVIWRGPDDEPNTTAAEGTFWRDGYAFPPNSVTPIYLDFSGTASTLSSAFRIHQSDFNGTWFNIGCGLTGDGAGGPNDESGRIIMSEEPPPLPTNTPRPTNTPGPTNTATATQPSATPSNTWTPRPPASNTPIPPPATNTPEPPPDDDGSGGYCPTTGC